MNNIWSKALQMAQATPETRNRYVDFLRALSILAVVFGHWLIAAPQFAGQQAKLSHMLDISPWTQWLTWLFQVMPVFFFVGGFSNLTSWLSAQRKNVSYSQWLESRLRRLLGPVLPLLIMWVALIIPANYFGVSAEMIRTGSQIALVPVWFLAVYIIVVLFVPWSHALWQRYRLGSVLIFAGCAVIVDLAFFVGNMQTLGWLNYLFVWLAVHQLGYAWREGLFPRPSVMLLIAAISLGTLLVLVCFGPYPLSLVGVPSDEISNTLPPKVTLLALAAFQIGLLISLESPARAWLSSRAVWAAVVLMNSMIMTVFLWHSTVMILIIGLSFWQFPALLSTAPGSMTWWLLRPVWMLVYLVFCLPFILLFMRFENPKAENNSRVISAWRLVLGSVLACFGLALLAKSGLGANNVLGISVIPLLLPFIGAQIAGLGLFRKP